MVGAVAMVVIAVMVAVEVIEALPVAAAARGRGGGARCQSRRLRHCSHSVVCSRGARACCAC
eukprot:7334780-Prymnesium_polylepis.1